MSNTPAVNSYSQTSQGVISLAAYTLTSALVGNPILCATTCIVDNAIKMIMQNTLPNIQNTAEKAKLLVIPAKVGVSFAIATALGVSGTSLLGTAALYATAKSLTFSITEVANTPRDQMLSELAKRVLASSVAYLGCSFAFAQECFKNGVLLAETLSYAALLSGDKADRFIKHSL